MRRQGFTLVEMLVAMALTMFVMVILSQAFIAALDTFRGLKAIGNMEEGLRTAVNNLRLDLQQNHFEGKRRLSDLQLGQPLIRQGFFAIYQGAAATSEGTDADGFTSYRTASHSLHFSIRLDGNRQENFLVAGNSTFATSFGQSPDSVWQQSGNFNSQWGEIAYFLRPQGTTDQPNSGSSATGGTPLYKLYRSQFALVPRSDQVNGTIDADSTLFNSANPQHQTVGCSGVAGGKVTFYSPDDLAAGSRTFNPASPLFASPPYVDSTGLRGATLLLNNVVSFDVQVMKNNFTKSNQQWSLDSDFGYLASSPFDSKNTPGDFQVDQFRIHAIQISIRVWDLATQQTRQITFIQDM